jgi:hypothetical protein
LPARSGSEVLPTARVGAVAATAQQTTLYFFDKGEADEQARLGGISAMFDQIATRHLAAVGVAQGWRCLEVGAGSGTIARWLADTVAADPHFGAELPGQRASDATTDERGERPLGHLAVGALVASQHPAGVHHVDHDRRVPGAEHENPDRVTRLVRGPGVVDVVTLGHRFP